MQGGLRAETDYRFNLGSLEGRLRDEGRAAGGFEPKESLNLPRCMPRGPKDHLNMRILPSGSKAQEQRISESMRSFEP